RPRAEPFQRSLGIKPDRNFAYIACCYTAISGEFGKIKAQPDCDVVNLGILGCDQYQLIAQQIDARVNFLAHAVVHPLQVSGERRYSMTSSAREESAGGTSRPSALAVVRLITNSNLVA